MTEAAKQRPLLLVIEDDEDIREGLAALLGVKGYAVVAAAQGLEALERLAGGLAPLVILLDVRMPVMDAAGFLEKKNADPSLAPIPVLLLTGADDDAGKAAALGVSGVVRKPIDIEGLLSAIGRFRR